MFTWQHPSGASSELLDRLIEALDAGAITYLFRVMMSKMDWDSRDKFIWCIKNALRSSVEKFRVDNFEVFPLLRVLFSLNIDNSKIL